MIGVLIFLVTALVLLFAGLTALLLYEMTHPPRHTAGYAVAKGLPSDPSEMGYEFDEWWVDRPDGARLPVWEVIAPPSHPKSASGLTVIFIHGWGHSRIDMLHHAERWRGQCDRLIFYDLRGHGEAERSNAQLGWNDREDLLALMARLGDGPLALTGFSMGAVVALSAAADHHDARNRVVGIIGYAPYARFIGSLRGRLHRHHLPARPMAELAVLIRRWIGRPPRDLGKALARVPCPVLIVGGESDVVAPLEEVRKVARQIPRAELHIVSNATHRDVHQYAGDAHDELVRAFVQRLVGTAPPAESHGLLRDAADST